MKKLGILFVFIAVQAFGQEKPFREIIETDSSTIEIIRNSIYRCYEETYKNKDSIWWSVSYIDDTTQVNTEGWKTKSGKYLGVWKEYTRQGDLMYTWDHDAGTCEVNPLLYPYHETLKKMKKIADGLIVSAYSQAFFDQHVRFDFDCYAYDKDGYVGDWTTPMERIPKEFLLRYAVRLSAADEYTNEMIRIDLDSIGNYIINSDYPRPRYGFEDLGKNSARTFNLDKVKAKEIAIANGLIDSKTSEITESLTWESFKNPGFYNGRFLYYLTEFTGKTEYTEGQNRKGIIFRYNVYAFNPWTGEFIEKKKMKSIREWGPHSGHSSGLMLDKE